MDIRQLQYLVALAREKHFTRAAESCGVTQPTLSGRIRQLEQELGVPIVQRGQRYQGLTTEGERVLAWAQRIVENCDGMRDELTALAGQPEGRVTLGVIPSALPTIPPLTEAMRRRFPQLGFTVLSQSSKDIARRLDEFAIDAGVTYLDNEPIDPGPSRPLYRERYRLFVRDDHPLADRAAVGWAEAAAYPLCALTPDMQNRRIIDRAFRQADVRPQPEVETNSVVHLCANIQIAGLAGVLPEFFIGMMGAAERIRAVALTEPAIEHTVGLVVLDRDPLPPLVTALLAVAEGYELPSSLLSRLD